MNFREALAEDERDQEFWRELDWPHGQVIYANQVIQARLIFMKDIDELWVLEQSSAFINGFLAAALIWVKDQTDDYYFILEVGDIIIPIGTDYNHYELTSNVMFYAVFRPDGQLLTTALQQETPDHHYGILISVQDSVDRNDIIALQSDNLEFVQGLLSAIDTFNIPYVLRHKIYKDGVYHDIGGRNLIIPTE